jgi:hypothetical protein
MTRLKTYRGREEYARYARLAATKYRPVETNAGGL